MGDVGIPVGILADDPNPETTNFTRFITTFAFLFECVGNIFNETRRIWVRQYPQIVAFTEQVGGDILPSPALCFIIQLLLDLAQIKVQMAFGPPSTTYHCFTTFSTTTLLSYALFCTVEDCLISCAGYDGTSLCVIVARLSKFLCLWIFAAALASLLYL